MKLARSRFLAMFLIVGLPIVFVSCSKSSEPSGPGSIAVSSTPSGAKIALDGTDVGKVTPARLENVDAGSHLVQLDLTGYRSWSGRVEVVSGRTADVGPTLVALTGALSIMTSPAGAAILVDGDDIGHMTPYVVEGLAFGSHELQFRLEGYLARKYNAQITSEDTTSFVQTLDPGWPVYASTRGDYPDADIMISYDAGETWKGVSLPASLTITVLAIDPNNQSVLYAGVNSSMTEAIFKSTDGGAMWHQSGSGMIRAGRGKVVSCIAVAPSNSDIVYASLSAFQTDDGNYYTDAGKFYYSLNGGSSWMERERGIPLYPDETSIVTQINTIAVSPMNQDNAFIGIRLLHNGFGYCYYNTSWPGWYPGQLWPSPATSNDVLSIVIDPRDANRMFAGSEDRLYSSTDGGKNYFILASHEGYSLCIDPCNSQVMYAGGTGTIMKTTDGGTSWTTLSSLSATKRITSIAIDGRNSQRIYAVSGSSINTEGLFKSEDGGATWIQVPGITRAITDVVVSPKS